MLDDKTRFLLDYLNRWYVKPLFIYGVWLQGVYTWFYVRCHRKDF